jgi:transcriptional regulator with XRE-family HTH domain
MVARIGPRRPFKHHLREWRLARGLSQQQLADRLDTSKGQISRWESGRRAMSGDVIAALADALSIEPGDLFRDPSAPSIDALLARAPAHVRETAAELVKALLKTAG